jgi:transcriptional regulator with XRE-family HTH domain
MVEALTYGRRVLWKLCQRTTQREVALRCGVVKSCVSEWLSGAARPSRTSAARMQALYGIAPNAWGPPPSSGWQRHRVR